MPLSTKTMISDGDPPLSICAPDLCSRFALSLRSGVGKNSIIHVPVINNMPILIKS